MEVGIIIAPFFWHRKTSLIRMTMSLKKLKFKKGAFSLQKTEENDDLIIFVLVYLYFFGKTFDE